MYKGHTILATICARGGSKGIPGKNIKPLAGKPMLAYSIEAAQQCEFIDRIVVSTDDLEIKKVAEKFGVPVPFMRDPSLAGDTVGRIAAVISAVQQAEKHFKESYDIILDLGNMSPLRTQADIEGTLKKLVDEKNTDVVFTVTEADRNPYYNMVEVDKKGYAQLSKRAATEISSRQQAPKVYSMNDSVYAMWNTVLMANKHITTPIQLVSTLKHRIFEMPPERSIDIDRPIDFKVLELLMSVS